MYQCAISSKKQRATEWVKQEKESIRYVAKYAEVVFERGKNINVEGLQVLQEMMKTMNPHQKFPRGRTGRWDQEEGNL